MDDLEAIEVRLQAILDPFRDRLEAFEIYGVPMLRRPGAKSHDWFAGVQVTNDAVKFNFLPMHTHPELLDSVSVALRKRKTGASVFKFAQVDDALFVELEAMLARSFESYMGGFMMDSAFPEVERRLREILAPHRAALATTKDGPDGLVLEIPGLEGKPWGYVAGVKSGKRYVSFHLMPIYGLPELMESMSPELRRRMQGKSCFNFTKVDELLFAELATLTAESVERYRAAAVAAKGGKPILE